MTTTYAQCMEKQLSFGHVGLVNLFLNTHINFLPETGNGRHTGGVRITHGLLYILRMGINDHTCSGIQTQNGPTTFEYMRVGQEIHNTVILVYRHALGIGHNSGIELSVRKDNALRIACRTTGIENVGNIIEGGFLLKLIHFRLTRKILSQFQEVAEIDGIRIVGRDVHHGVEDDDTLQGRTQRENATSLVILVLFTDKEIANLGVVDHKLNLLLRTGGIEGDSDSTDTPCTEITLDILN